jgi:parvulin-like peptidyl-prolyl isomerase
MRKMILGLVCSFVAGSVSYELNAQDNESKAVVDRNNPEVVLAYQGEAILTQAGIDAAFSRIPEQDRLAFIRDGAKVDKMVKNLLQTELIAVDADVNGFSRDPIVRERMELAARIELAAAWMEEVLLKAPDADYLAMAREEYLANPSTYSSPATVDVTHILISTKARLPSEAEAIALKLQVRLAKNPDEFDALVVEYSEDPGKDTNGGRYKDVTHGQLVKPFEEAAFGMETVGQITGPVETEYGFHLIRLDKKQEAVLSPFEEVQDDIVEKMKAKHLADFRVSYMQKLLHSAVVFPDGSVEIMAKRHFGENLEGAPIFSEEGVETGTID